MINKLLPIFDSSKKIPSFYVAKNLSKSDLKDVIRLYEYMMSLDTKKITIKTAVREQLEN